MSIKELKKTKVSDLSPEKKFLEKIDPISLWMIVVMIFLLGFICGATFQIFWMHHLYNTPIFN